MLQLTGHEIHKLLRNKGIGIGLLLCILVQLLYAYNAVPSFFNNYHKVHQYYMVGQGKVTDSDVASAREGMKRLKKLYDDGIRFYDKDVGQKLLYRDVFNAVSESGNYKKLMSRLENSTDAVQKLQYKMLQKVGPVDSAYYTEGWRVIIDFWGHIGYYLAVILGIFGASRIFPDERTEGMDALIKSTKEGRRKLVSAKICTAVLFIAAVTLSLELVNLVFNGAVYGLAGWNAPLKNVFFHTSFHMNLLQFWTLKLIMQMLCTTVFCLFAMLVSIIMKNSIAAAAIAGVMFLAYDALTKNIKGTMAADFMRLNGFCADYRRTGIYFGHAMPYEHMLIVIVFLMMAVLMLASYVAGSHAQ